MSNKGKVSVRGKQVPEAVIQAAIARMSNGEKFRCSDITRAIESAPGSAGLVCMRVADRLIQRERQAGNIKYTEPTPYWRWAKS